MDGIGSNLKRARLLKGLSLNEAGELMNMSATAIAKYEKNEITPDSTKIILFSKAYGVSIIELLSIYEKPKMTFSSFSKRKRLKGEKLELLKELILRKVSKYLEVLKLSGLRKKVILNKYKINNLKEVNNIVNIFRKEMLGINELIPISDLTSILESLGIVIIYIEDKDNIFSDFDGLSEVVEGIPIIVLSDINDGARQRFTLAHELGHLLLDINEELDEEKVCNIFASSLLLPKLAMINEFGVYRVNINFYELEAIKNKYKVSYKAIVYRLKEIGVIKEYSFKNLNILLNKIIGSKDPNPLTTEKSYQFKKLVYRLESLEIIGVQKVIELLEINIDEYNEENYYN